MNPFVLLFNTLQFARVLVVFSSQTQIEKLEARAQGKQFGQQ